MLYKSVLVVKNQNTTLQQIVFDAFPWWEQAHYYTS